MDISILICTWNNCQRLEVTLESLEQCAVPDQIEWEVVVVNNNCTDDTQSVLQKFASRLPLQIVNEPRQGLSIARNSGLNACGGELVIFTDDDVRVVSNWPAIYWNAYKKYGNKYFYGGPVTSEFEGEQPCDELLQVAPASVTGLDLGDTEQVLIATEYFLAANWACQKELLLTSGGFDESMGLNPSCNTVQVGEETDLMIRLREQGVQAWCLPQASLKHWVPKNKCSLEHSAERYEASGRIRWQSSYAEPGSLIYRLTGIPRWLLKQVVLKWLAWRTAQLCGRKSILRYLHYRRTVGTIREARDSRSPENNSTYREGTSNC